MSSFTWLDFAESDRRRAQDVIDLFREQDTRDELGTATIRDALSDWFFPGTSAIQTRARYFLIIPWTYQYLERKKVPSAEIAKRARDTELSLIDVLADSDDSEGTIGVRARRTLKRLPSGIYWQGMSRLGLLQFSGSRDQYHRSLDGLYARKSTKTIKTDDGEVLTAGRSRNWHVGIPSAPPGFPRECSLTLTRIEADFLRERIMHAAPRSLLARLVDGSIPASDSDLPWEHEATAALPAKLRTELEHAQQFSELMHGANLLYNFWLAQLKHDSERVDHYGSTVEQWSNERLEKRQSHSAWRLEDLWSLVAQAGGRVPLPTQAFVTRWITLVRDNFGRDLRANDSARSLILERERQLKRSLARLDGGRALEMWGGESGFRQLDFRWNSIVKRIVRDIHDGLES